MDNGYDGKLNDQLLGLAIKDPHNNNDSLFRVMKAVEDAEATIKQQVEENNRLRTELQKKAQEVERYRLYDSVAQRSGSVDRLSEHIHGPFESRSLNSEGNQDDKVKNISSPQGTNVLRQHLKSNSEDVSIQNQNHVENQSGTSKVNGMLKVLPSGQVPADNISLSQFTSPSATSLSPNRYPLEGEYESRFNLSGNDPLLMAEVNNHGSLWKQDLVLKFREHEDEIMQLRKRLAEYSIKEAHICNEKHVLETRIAYMRLAFDQQQQDLVDAASKALTYRQDIIEENIRLTYALQAAQQERSTFVSSLLPLLAEYSLQPPVSDAHSIVSNVKVLFKHLLEKLIMTESKLKESQYQLAPWNSDVNHSNFAPESLSYSVGAALTTSKNNGLELVPQTTYSHGKIPVSSSDAQPNKDLGLLAHEKSELDGVVSKNLEPHDIGWYSPLAIRNFAPYNTPAQHALTRNDAHTTHYNEESSNKQVTFRDPVSNSEMDDQAVEGHQTEREPPSANWSSGTTAYTPTVDDPSSSYSPYLPPVLEEPSSSFSEVADDDPLPAIEGLQISGEAFPGRELQASGYSINGTTSCNFEWVRHMEDGSVNYIDGAKQPNYLVTADDVDTYIAIEVQPLDNRKRKGELVKVFANEHRKIPCDPDMVNHIEKIFNNGHASYKVSLSTRYLDIWESATLAVKREGYSIKCSGPSGVVVNEKFSPSTIVTIPYGHATEFSIIGSDGAEHLLRANNSSMDITSSRDTIVLTLRFFIIRAGEKRKGKRRGLFFNK